MRKLSNLSLYDIKKAARSAQSSLFTSDLPAFESELRKITTNDPWGPSTKQLNGLLDISTQDNQLEPYQEVEIICQRIIRYLNPESYTGDSRHRSNSISSSIYNAAVNYVNSGSEWRIIHKCLKVLEFLLLHTPNTYPFLDAIGANQICIEQVIAKYSKLYQDIEKEYKDDVIPSAKLQDIENAKAIIFTADGLLLLYKDKEFRNNEIAKALKLSNQVLDTSQNHGNNVKPLKKNHDVPSYEKNFKHKSMDRHKVQHSNIKSQVRNELSHVYHNDNDKSLGIQFNLADDSGNFINSGNSLIDDFDENYEEQDNEQYKDYDDDDDLDNKYNPNSFATIQKKTFHDDESINDGFKDEDDDIPKSTDDLKVGEENDKVQVEEDDDFGDFQRTPIKPTVNDDIISLNDDIDSSKMNTLNTTLTIPSITAKK